jgi:hypothetical protein
MTIKYINKPILKTIVVEYEVENEAGEKGIITEVITPSHSDSDSDVVQCTVEEKTFYWHKSEQNYSVQPAFDCLSRIIKSIKAWHADHKNDGKLWDAITPEIIDKVDIDDVAKELEETENG